MEDQQAGELWVIVAAAGESRRMGLPDGESKQFLLLGGEPILNHSVRRLLAMPEVDGIVVVLHPSHTVRFAGELLAFDDTKPLLIAEGGRTRLGLGARRPAGGAGDRVRHRRARRRPAAVRQARLRALHTALCNGGRRRARHRGERHAQARGRGRRSWRPAWTGAACGRAQTPQVFRAAALRDVYTRPGLEPDATDDAALLEKGGYKVRLRAAPRRPTSRSPRRPTSRWPARCSPGRSRQTFRVGSGYDAHRFAGGRRLVLCGVEVDHPQGLAGHSDADVAVHALMDALLGAAGLGDIGELFPDTDAGVPAASRACACWARDGALGAGRLEPWRTSDVVRGLRAPAPRASTGRRCARGWRPRWAWTPTAVGVKGTTTRGHGIRRPWRRASPPRPCVCCRARREAPGGAGWLRRRPACRPWPTRSPSPACLVVVCGSSSFEPRLEALDALAHGAAELGQAGGAEEQQDDEDDEADLQRTKVGHFTLLWCSAPSSAGGAAVGGMSLCLLRHCTASHGGSQSMWRGRASLR